MEPDQVTVMKRRRTNDPYRSKVEKKKQYHEKRRTMEVSPQESLMDNFVVGSKI